VSATHVESDYRPDIDGLRAVAILAVLACHAGPLPGGLIGVDVFFVISGFLISRNILGNLASGRFSILDFYVRRVKRIFPALILVLLTVAAAGGMLLPPDKYQQLGLHLVQGAAFTVNFYPQQDPDPLTRGLAHLWSLGVEEQFYLLWPLLLLGTALLRRGRFVVIVSASVLSLVLNVTSDPQAFLSYTLPWLRLWELSLGGALAYIQLHEGARSDGSAASRSPSLIARVPPDRQDYGAWPGAP
jgi:peptidoglycan/LPS O-acetylase OafA/YrhL